MWTKIQRDEIDALAGKIITHSDLRGDRLTGSLVGYLYAEGTRIGLAHGLRRSGMRQSAK